MYSLGLIVKKCLRTKLTQPKSHSPLWAGGPRTSVGHSLSRWLYTVYVALMCVHVCLCGMVNWFRISYIRAVVVYIAAV